ncbi:helix-turn-helix transcriptional regulator [Nocardioides sp. AE5]|uniref:helix-turn-helix domain-containing protein n=1 Tax=Nocardioides sp. AE5 TaxID=2962573 RepID=UPI0028819669|nr:helix-turn-helix transcriptional regulator [Nocardioides sp. AE5]MDT0201004.1 helix-turn-helix transcriptional regulator [Nocardioides sp. AE5]
MRSRPTHPAIAHVSAVLGRKVQAAREARRMTQEELAHRAGISRNHVQNIERSRNNQRDPETGKVGPANPRLSTIYAVADAFRVDVTWLMDPEIPIVAMERLPDERS